ncbi:heparan-alpha-glucosaminide N-acetyltransferase [Enterovirga aerilata]|uniref:DUF1624 domain-containing protein n=1 Tax=Enterovirga aerilata TaxID=2730920 RepID=A0A849IK53_9HYPH|nr:heparan-alpha-glucosaminide N-acetyltransferase [Enterovirga sp. DB1703]NNM74313.1 DUF1624 domain-containing protein [Enterovirga sp. DB1703]
MVSLSNAALKGGASPARGRIGAIDIARGVAVAAMVVYHFAWDLSELRLIATEVTAEPGWRFFARAIAASFLLLAGLGLALAHPGRIRWRAFALRLATVAGAALIITGATFLAFPDSYIFFGILHAIALSSLLAVPFTQAPAWVAAALAVLIGAAPLVLRGGVFEHPALAFLGLASRPPITNDWVPLLPWAAFVFAGVALGKLLEGWLKAQTGRLRSRAGRAFAWAGRHSLVIYLLHQPLLFGALYGLVQVTGPNLAAVAKRVERGCPASYLAAGFAEPVARATCSCTVDKLRRAGIWSDFLRERLSEGQRAELAGIARACLARSRPAG